MSKQQRQQQQQQQLQQQHGEGERQNLAGDTGAGKGAATRTESLGPLKPSIVSKVEYISCKMTIPNEHITVGLTEFIFVALVNVIDFVV